MDGKSSIALIVMQFDRTEKEPIHEHRDVDRSINMGFLDSRLKNEPRSFR